MQSKQKQAFDKDTDICETANITEMTTFHYIYFLRDRYHRQESFRN